MNILRISADTSHCQVSALNNSCAVCDRANTISPLKMLLIFTARRYDSAVYDVVVCLSVMCMYVRPKAR